MFGLLMVVLGVVLVLVPALTAGQGEGETQTITPGTTVSVTVPEGVNVMLVDSGTSMTNPVAIGFVLPDGSTVTKAYENGVMSSFPSQESVVWFDANGSRGVVGETYPEGMVFYGRQVYDVTVSWTLDGTDHRLSYEVVAGDVIALPAIVKPGYEFAGWEIAGREGILYVGSYTVTDAHAVGPAIAMTPVFVKTEDPIVEPTVQVSIGGKTYEMAAGDVVNLPVLEKTGFEFLGWQILDGDAERPGYYTGQYVITEADVEAGVLIGFEACYRQTLVPEPGETIQVTVGGTVLDHPGHRRRNRARRVRSRRHLQPAGPAGRRGRSALHRMEAGRERLRGLLHRDRGGCRRRVPDLRGRLRRRS